MTGIFILSFGPVLSPILVILIISPGLYHFQVMDETEMKRAEFPGNPTARSSVPEYVNGQGRVESYHRS